VKRSEASLEGILTNQGKKLEGLLDEVLNAVQAVGEQVKVVDERLQGLEKQIQKVLEQLQLQNREVRPSDSLSLSSDSERQMVSGLVQSYRTLPEEQRRAAQPPAGRYKNARRNMPPKWCGLLIRSTTLFLPAFSLPARSASHSKR
jgi:hypothetical protein